MNITDRTHFAINSDGILPKRATKYSAGYDLALPYDAELEPKSRICINTGVSVINSDPRINTFVLPRSGLFRKTGLLMSVDPSSLDPSSVTKGIVIELNNVGMSKVRLDRGTNVGQILFTSNMDAETDAVPYTVQDDGQLSPAMVPDPHGILSISVPGDISMDPGEAKAILTHTAFAFVPSKVLLLFPSHLLKDLGVHLVNQTGVIDADYFANPTNKGAVMAQFINLAEKKVVIKSKTPILDAYTADYYVLALEDEPDSIRIGGLGSTGD